jgi:phenylalanyl-tRNA synthetase alpha chain
MQDLNALEQHYAAAAGAAASLAALEEVRVAALGKNGALTALMKELGKLAPEERKARGAALNKLKDAVAAVIAHRLPLIRQHIRPIYAKLGIHLE